MKKRKLMTPEVIKHGGAGLAAIGIYFTTRIETYAQAFDFDPNADRLEFPEVNNIFSTIIVTAQYFSGALAMILLIYAGGKVMFSSDSPRAMEEVKGGIARIFVGLAIIFLATTIVRVFIEALAG